MMDEPAGGLTSRYDLESALALARSLPAEPHEILTHDRRGPYLHRWVVEKNPDGSAVHIHRFLRSDGDDEMHDHTGDSETLVLEEGYWEVTREGRSWLGVGDRHFRPAGRHHRVELEPGRFPLTLFVKGPRTNVWSFLGLDGSRIAPEDFVPGA